MHRCNRRMIVVTRNHLWLMVSHHKGPSNADVTSLTKIITSLQKCSWNHLWDHLCGLILDTSVIANVWFNYDFILLSEFSYTYLHQASKHQQQINVKNRTGPADIHIGIYFPLFLSFLLPTLSSCFFFYHVSSFLFLLLFHLLLFFHHTVTFISCYLCSCYFFSGAKLLLFSRFFISIQTVTFFPVTFFPVTFFPTQNCYFFSCYLFSCYFLSEHQIV